MTGPQDPIRFGDFVLDVAARQLRRSDEDVVLQRKAFDTLVFLVQHTDRVVSKDELLSEVWAGAVVTENAIARVISALRGALDDKARPAKYIRAVPRIGYQFVAPVQRNNAASSGRALAVLPFRQLGEAPPASGLGLASALRKR